MANNSSLNQELVEESNIFAPAYSTLSRRGDMLADIKNNNSEKSVQAYEKLATLKKMTKREGWQNRGSIGLVYINMALSVPTTKDAP